MGEVLIPLTFDDLPVRPPLTGRPRISDDIQQTAALLVGWDGVTRRLIRVSPTGVLHVAQAVVKGISNILADQDAYTWQGGNIKTSEVLIKSNPDNVGRIWVNVGAAAAVDTGHPIDAGEHLIFSVNNLDNLYLYIAIDTEKASIIYSK